MKSSSGADAAENRPHSRAFVRQFLANYGMVFVLALLCGFFAWATVHANSPTGREGAVSLAADVRAIQPKPQNILIVASPDDEGHEFAEAVAAALRGAGLNASTVIGDPPTVRETIEKSAASGSPPDLVPRRRAAGIGPSGTVCGVPFQPSRGSA